MPSGTGQEYAAQKNAVGQPANPSSHYHMQTRSPHVCGSKTPGEKEPFQNPNFTQNVSELEVQFPDSTYSSICTGRLVDPEIHIPELTESFLYYKNGTCISEVLLNYRQRQVESKSLLNSNQIKEIMSLSFVFFDPLICDLQEEERVRWRQSLGGNDRAFVSDLTEVCCRRKREEAMRALLVLGLKHDCIMSPLYLTAHSLLSTSILWADNVLDQDNEGSFIERFFKPLVNAFFGQFENARLCWINDVLKTGHVDIGERIVPKVMLSTSDPQHTVLVGEVTIPEASQHELNRNRVKLFIEMKHCLDGLLDYGVDSPVVGLLVQRHRVEVWSMTLPYEALYIPTKLGSFDLILSRFNFGTFFAMAPPLLAAKAIIQNSLTQLSRVRGWPLKSGWRRDTSALAPLPLGVTYPSTMRPLQRKRTGEDVNMQ
ncbi:hypothetical protein BGW38_001181 [Lunasporangiospora selenospora]|uniref:Uncharacterized protein n=1 Tax=Lunasporangiospora selenospora TaxID=979761 RepID=A0A9P6G1D8_9FUNG|nr:hypothetical protein BGW38_001181 [Lunasporangiospora selenospora]